MENNFDEDKEVYSISKYRQEQIQKAYAVSCEGKK